MGFRSRDTAQSKPQSLEQRAAARLERKGARRINRHSDAREVACDIMGIKYKPVPAPQDERQFNAVVASIRGPFQSQVAQRVPDSWEMLTERAK